jgi:hypothetical protein
LEYVIFSSIKVLVSMQPLSFSLGHRFGIATEVCPSDLDAAFLSKFLDQIEGQRLQASRFSNSQSRRLGQWHFFRTGKAPKVRRQGRFLRRSWKQKCGQRPFEKHGKLLQRPKRGASASVLPILHRLNARAHPTGDGFLVQPGAFARPAQH